MEQKLEQFIAYLTEMDEEKFFYLARNFLPETTTPYNKQLVAERLASFFLNESKKEALLSTLGPLDCLILALLQLRPSATLADLLGMLEPFEKVSWDEEQNDYHSYDLFSGITYPDFVAHLSSMAKRLILIFDNGMIKENPLLEDDLKKKATLYPLSAYFSTHVPSAEPVERITGTGYLNQEFLKAFLSCGGRNLSPHSFPQLEVIQLNYFQTLLDAYAREYGNLENLLMAKDDKSFLAQLLSQQPEEKAFYMEAFALLSKNRNMEFGLADYLLRQLAVYHKLRTDSAELLDKLEILGIARRQKDYLLTNELFIDSEQERQGTLLVDSDLSISYIGKRNGSDLLWKFSHIERLDLRTIYKVDKKDIVRAFDSGCTLEQLVCYLKENTQQDNLGFLLDFLRFTKDEYSQVSLLHGTVLKGNERIANIMEHHPQIQQFILARLAPGIFLMDSNQEEAWTAILQGAGILVPKPQHPHTDRICIPVAEEPKAIPAVICPLDRKPQQMTFDSDSLRKQIELSDFKQNEKKDLLKRLDEKMIVDASQLGANVLEQRPSASGFAYRSKVNICQMATKDPSSLLVLNYRGKKMLVAAKKVLDKGKEKAILIGLKLPGYKEVQLDITKMFQVELTKTMLG
ncbi:MAG: hypothetical protein LKE40_03205 [Spirochaetia bacterium]|jgi:hypothetical protein|nr:hypothetical protein [Spirochaetia bacterium]